jgi:hypothetical protein
LNSLRFVKQVVVFERSQATGSNLAGVVQEFPTTLLRGSINMRFTRTLLSAALSLSAVFFSGYAAASNIYDYSYTFGTGQIVSGEFTGTATGNLITGISNITASLNGVAFNDNGNLVIDSYDFVNYKWISGTGVASFDGTQNNFFFSDGDINGGTISNYFFSIAYKFTSNTVAITNYDGVLTGGGQNVEVACPYGVNGCGPNPYLYSATNWSVAQVNATPEPTSIALVGAALFGLAASRRKHSQH